MDGEAWSQSSRSVSVFERLCRLIDKTFHGNIVSGLDLVVKGQLQPRLFLPLSSQQLSGRVVEITKARGIGVSLTIKTSCGRMVKAGRGVVYAFGWWLGKADLASCMQDGKCFATTFKIANPVISKNP